MGVIAALMCTFVFMTHKKNKRLVVVRGCIVLAVTLSLLIVFTMGVIAIKKCVSAEAFGMSSFYSRFFAKFLMGFEERYWRYSIFDSYFLRVIDTISSYRLSIWSLGIRQIELKGKGFEGFLIGSDMIQTPHSFYILALINYGWVGGGFIIIWFALYLASAAKRCLEHDEAIVLSAIWIFFCIANFFFTCETWASPVYFGLLFLQYPLMRYRRNELDERNLD